MCVRVFYQLAEWIAFREQLPVDSTLGFVPTMGNLHAGHASLFKQSVSENHATVSSLFINPTQFNQAEDFKNYPRTLDADLKLMEDAGVAFCLVPEEQDIYQDNKNFQIQEHHLSCIMEGLHRPGHFYGVLTVVMKLLHLTRPTRAYFGEKDYQQYQLITQMVAAFFMRVDIVPCPTVREPSGLAYSSRNNRLNATQRLRAELFARLFLQPQLSCESIARELERHEIEVEYIEEYQGRRYAAVRIDAIRLIDNYKINV